MNDFWVLLGPDYVGKSSLMLSLAGRLGSGWRMVSYDDELLDAEHAMMGRLRADFLVEALGGVGRTYSSDFLLSILQAAVVYLRDRALEALPTRRVLVDSYYYKILVKCALAGFGNDALFGWWRTFPQPRGILYLDADPVTAWNRHLATGGRLNRLEHYGERPTRPAFERFQDDLRRRLLREIGGLPTTMLDATQDADTLAADAAMVLSGRGGRAGG